jgi:1-acyl-sn-glycerol-3-phosphate acyltransferase
MRFGRFRPPPDPLKASIIVVLAHGILRLLFRLFLRIEVKGAASLPKEGPYILIANHLSRFDPLLIIAAFPLRPRMWFLAAAGPTIAVPWRRMILRVLGGIIPIYEKNRRSGKVALRRAESILAANGILGIFPEGQVGREEWRLQPVRPGAASISMRLGVPIIPVWIAGPQRLFWHKRVQIVVGDPFYPPLGVSREASTASLSAALLSCRTQVEPWLEPESPPGLWINKLL